MTDDEKALAMFKAYVDASDQELADWGVFRETLLSLARKHITAERDDELARLGETVIRDHQAKGAE